MRSAADDRIELRRFGVFNVKPRKTGIGRNPRTGQQVNIPPGKAVRFKPGKELQALPAARRQVSERLVSPLRAGQRDRKNFPQCRRTFARGGASKLRWAFEIVCT